MIKPRLMTQQFVQKIRQEQIIKKNLIETMLLSKNFYIFIGILAFCLCLFLFFRYFDKKDRVKKKKKEIVEEVEEEEYMDFEKDETMQNYERENPYDKTTTLNMQNKYIPENGDIVYGEDEEVNMINKMLLDKMGDIPEIKFN